MMKTRHYKKLQKKVRACSGHTFRSFFTPQEVMHLAQQAGFKERKLITAKDLAKQYFADRTDGLLPASGEMFLLATT